ncbi:MAG: PBP1A family penicillin-binding protein [Clostridium butyricum]|nr:PBP1A family penicillin-binding protein [Clostridium butyricum]
MAVNNPQKPNSSPQSKKKRKSKKSKTRKSKKVFTNICFGLLFCFLAIFVIFAGYAFAIIKTTPPLDVNAVLTLNQPSSLYDSNGDFMDNLHTEEERYVIESSEMPQNLKNAFISIEDERFMKHSGIDIQRIVGAAVLDVKKILTGQRGLHGASTITQQLLKNTILTNDVSIERKIKEVYLAVNLEKKLTKDQIITAYLNTIPLGGTAYGVEAASLMYFSKSASDLSLIECAYLAGITQAPTYYSAYTQSDPNATPTYIKRTNTVLSMMHELGYITESEYNEAVNEVNNGGLVFKRSKVDYKMNYEWFVYPAISQVKEDLKEKYKYTDEEVSKLIVNGGLQIYTTMDRDLQEFTQSTLNDYSNLGISNVETYDADGVPLLQASATIVNYKTGEVLAMVGGRGAQNPQSTNRAYNALKPIGSTTKPLTVYGPAINEKVITAATVIDDAPFENNTLNNGQYYNPKNSPNEYTGLITARDGVKYSKNVVSVKVADMLGLDTAVSYGEQLGLKYNSASKTSIASVALGEFNNNPEDLDGGNTFVLANAFGTFGNNGLYTEPVLYTKVVDSSGKTILENKKPVHKEIFSPQTAYIMYDILKGPISYNASGAKWGDMPVAGKTGTTTSSTNLWFSGLSPYLSASVWVGYDNPTTLYGSSSSCASIWGKLMQKAHENYAVTEIEKPTGLVISNVCRDSGLLPSNLCSSDPRGNRIITEYFIEGTEPSNTCETHISANVNILNGKLSTPATPSILTKSKVFISKDNPNPATADYPYVLPSLYDNTIGLDESNGPVEFYPSDDTTQNISNNPNVNSDNPSVNEPPIENNSGNEDTVDPLPIN